ncbi:MAG TPA: glutathione S-transferase family protein [Polyangiales bacterium]|nr:glutathione S-transferase family protein [Polyangiales bacterium]
MTRILYAMPYSPWSERARFALLHHACEFEEREHLPVIGELALRMRARRYFGRVSVPLLIEDNLVVMDSMAIAEHVDGIGSGSRLFPAEHRAAIHALNDQIEPMFQATRARVVQTSQVDTEAAIDLVPPQLRSLPFAAASGRLGARIIAWKHPTPSGDYRPLLREGLERIRAALAGRRYIHGEFSYADIIGASAVQQVAPVAERFVPIGPVKRRTWADPALAAEFTDLVAWRDALYEKHRPVRS